MSIAPEEVTTFTCGFASMIEEGQSLMRSLTALAEQQPNQEFRQVIEQITQEVGEGVTLSRAFLKHADVFGESYAHSVRQGEVNGNLDLVLRQLCSG